LKAPQFHYVRPGNLAETLQILAEHGEEARILAGGQSLMPTLNMRLSHPKILVDINRIEPLRGIAIADGMVRIGALARHVEVMNSPVIEQHLPLIAEAMPHVAHVAVRNRGTFGGSVALADPAAELPACVLALGGTLVVESVRGRRSVAADDYFLGLYETARAADEILVEVLLPVQKPGHVSAFLELARRHGDYAMAGLACYGCVKSDFIEDVRLVYFGSEDRPVLGKHAMAAVNGKTWSAAARDAMCAALADDLDPIDNTFGTPATKLHLQRVLTGRALDRAVERARLQ
jgi:carbon-monoxide dehydrogenase medium subunit